MVRIATPTKHVVGFSGGIDSQACARWVLNRYPADDVILLNSDAGGNEHPLTTEFIEWYSANVHPVVTVSAIVADMGGMAKQRIAELGLNASDALSFDTLALLKGRFPSRRMQFCTELLKLRPTNRWIKTHLMDKGVSFVRYTGVRRQESRSRSKREVSGWDDSLGMPMMYPIVDWTKQMCFDYVNHHGEKINELYTLGFNRVGCAPCVNSGKDDVRAWSDRAPEMIDKVRKWEKRVGRTFFAPMVPGKDINWIDDVVEWSRTVRGGRQLGLHVLQPRPACESDYGLCE